MIQSMTGYGRAVGQTALGEMQIELRGVNSKHLDLKVRTPRFLFPLEPMLQSSLRQTLGRGRVECNVNLSATGGQTARLQVNEQLAEAYIEAGDRLKTHYGIEGITSAEFLLRLPEVVQLEDPEVDFDQLWQQAEPILKKAVEGFCELRLREGKQLEKDFRQRIESLRGCVEKVDEFRDEQVDEYHERLSRRVSELCADINIDEARLAQEVAFLAERSDITEEVVRLRSHLDQFEEILEGTQPAGRQLDFLLQEIFREVNTIGSKTEMIKITRLVIQMKNEVDKLREQVQNVM